MENTDVIFDDLLQNDNEQRESDGEPNSDTGDDAHLVDDANVDSIQPDRDDEPSEPEVEFNLDDFTYYPGICSSARYTAVQPPRLIGYEQEISMLDMPSVENDIPTSYEDALKKGEAEKWLEYLQ